MKEKLSVFFINPPLRSGEVYAKEGRCAQKEEVWAFPFQPLSILQAAGVAREKGYDIVFLDSDKPFEVILEKIKAGKPEVVVINTVTPTLYSDSEIAKEIKCLNSKIKVVAIGAHVTLNSEEVLQEFKNFDIIIRGEPDEIIVRLLSAIERKGDLGKVPNIAFRKGNGIIKTKIKDKSENFPKLPLDLIDFDRYLDPFHGCRTLMVNTGRGCPYNCVFCISRTYSGRKYRARNPQEVADEMKEAYDKYCIRSFILWSDTFTLDKQHCMKICQKIIEKKMSGIHLIINARVDRFDREIASSLKNAGCWAVSFGLESGCQEILDGARKGISLQQIEAALKICDEFGLYSIGHSVFGLPGENKETIERSIQFFKRLPLDFLQCYCAVPYPGSDLYSIASDKGWIVDSDLSHYEQDRSVMRTSELTTKEVEKARNRAYREFIFRPKFVFRQLRFVFGYDPIFLFRNALRFLKNWAFAHSEK